MIRKIRESDILTMLMLIAIEITIAAVLFFCAGREQEPVPTETQEEMAITFAPTSTPMPTPTPTPTPTLTPTPTPIHEIVNGRLQPNDTPYYEQCGLSEEEFEYFARVVQAEQNAHYEGQVWVAECIWNRTKDEGGYGGTVTHVLNASGQFSTTSGGKCKTKATDESRKAVVEAYLNVIFPENVLYFRSGHYFSGHKKYAECGNNYFSY